MRWLMVLLPFTYIGPTDIRGHYLFTAFASLARFAIKATLSLIIVYIGYQQFPPDYPSASEVSNKLALVQEELDELQTAPTLIDFKIHPDEVRLCVRPLDSTASCDTAPPVTSDFFEAVIECEHCQRIEADAIHVLSVKQILEIPPLTRLFDSSLWAFRELSFGAGPYVISALLVEAAQNRPATSARTPNPDLTASEVARIRELIDRASLGLPSAKDPSSITARRFGGPIQIACFVLFAYGVLSILLSYLTTVLPNTIVRSERYIRLRGLRYRAEVAPGSDPSEGAYINRLVDISDPDAVDAEDRLETPWRSGHLFGNPNQYTQLYSEVFDSVQARCALHGPRVIVPLAQLRRIGYMAIQADPQARTVPDFLSAEAEGLFDLLEARNKAVQYLIWAIPTLGFIGTVLGIGDALSSTIDIGANVLSIKSLAESSVGASIGLAFDTTFVALCLSVALMALYYILQQAQETMIALEKRSALEDIVTPFNIPTGLPAVPTMPTGAAPGRERQPRTVGPSTTRIIRTLVLVPLSVAAAAAIYYGYTVGVFSILP